MPDYLPPGVYVNEVEARLWPIEGVETAVAAFVGLAEQGPLNEPTRVNNFAQFVEIFGDLTPGGYLAPAVYGYLQNGGRNCFVVRTNDIASLSVDRSKRDTPTAVEPGHAEHLGDRDEAAVAAERAPFSGLDECDQVTMVAVPDLVMALERREVDLDSYQAIQRDLIAHCEYMGGRMAILDPPPDLDARGVLDWRVREARYDAKFAAIYWPYLQVFEPATGTKVFVPPCGHVAGVWARNDDMRGVHKAPANEVVRGAITVRTNVISPEQDLLNPLGINCIRAFPGRGIRVWGARTLSSDPDWRYLNVRRLLNYLEQSIFHATRWVVFEPNDTALWARIQRTVSAFLVREWRKGALIGTTPEEAYFVKCDDETNIAETIDAGKVICQIGVALVKPGEFVIFQLSQSCNGFSSESE